MKRSHAFLGGSLALVLLLALLAPSALFADDTAQAPYTVKDLNEQMVMAMAWVQTSAEYKELCYQAFNFAGMIVDKAVATAKKGDKPLAVIADLDETLIDNSAYDAGLIGTDSAYSGKTWTLWELAAQARAVPGAVDFLTAAARRGVEIFYVTNRDQAGLPGTLKNLAALGFPFADEKHVMVNAGTSDKQPRFDAVAKDHTVVLYMGDNANDLPIGTYGKAMKDRNAIVDQNRAKFGTQFIALPNPVYGDWEPAVAPGYWGLSPKGKSDARKAQMYTWVPAQ
ncbi:MAG TPA: 5'-nucleotidase, lipoprotein e(P4) family [Rectinemataceae bacterium]|nr:5'-nucleotidase, lipoprotein e(P4) family [Rectinemataceae bacterium]